MAIVDNGQYFDSERDYYASFFAGDSGKNDSTRLEQYGTNLLERQHGYQAAEQIGNQLKGFKGVGILPKATDPEYEKELIEDRTAPIYNRALEQQHAKAKAGKDDLGKLIGQTAMPQQFAPSIDLIRHGEIDSNVKDLVHGWNDESLTTKGRSEAEKAAGELKANPPTILVHSDLKRATETANIIADKTGAQLIPSDKLRTWDIGDMEGMPCSKGNPILKHYAIETPNKPIPGGESFNNFKHRVIDGFHEAMEAGADGLVVHNKVERLIRAWEANNFHGNRKLDMEVFHDETPKTGTVEKLQLAGDVIPGPGFGGGFAGRGNLMQTQGVKGMNQMIGVGRAPNISNVELHPSPYGPKGTYVKEGNEFVLREEGFPDIKIDPKYNKDLEERLKLFHKGADILPFPGGGGKKAGPIKPEDLLE